MAAITIVIAALTLNVISATPPQPAESVPIPGGLDGLARALDIAPPDRARCAALIARLIYADNRELRFLPDSKYRRMLSHFASFGAARSGAGAAAADLVPLPLPARVWSEAVFHRPIPPHELFAAVMSDEAAAMLVHGLAALDDDTLRFLAEHPSLVARLYQRDAAVFAAFGAQLRIRDGGVVPPGGIGAAALWEAVLHEKISNPEAFVGELFNRDKGRIAYLYDTIAHLDSPRASFALGLWIDDPVERGQRFEALAWETAKFYSHWNVRKRPFSRPAHDVLSMFLRVRVDSSGAPAFQNGAPVWGRVFDVDGEVRAKPREADAAWLASILMRGHAEQRVDRLDQLAFGERLLAHADAASLQDAIDAIRGLSRFRTLLLTLERMGVEEPSVYAAFVRQAERISGVDRDRQHAALAQFQGAIALVARLALVQTIDRRTTNALLASLVQVPFDAQRGYRGALSEWLQRQLRPALHARTPVGLEDALVQSLGGRRGHAPRPIAFEGQAYLFDLATTEAARIARFRQAQDGPTLDQTMDLHRIASELRAAPAAASDERVAQLAERLLTLVDTLVGDALLSFSYAIDWNDPQGNGRFARSVARRHDFGLARTNREVRMRMAWVTPTRVLEAGKPWRIEGAILGLDAGLAALALKRISADAATTEPVLSSTERHTFVTSLGLMNPFLLADDRQREIAEAIARGQRRVALLSASDRPIDEVIREVRMDGWRERALRWAIVNDPEQVAGYFSMTDLLYLGGGRDLDIDAWGMSAIGTLGCLCTRVSASAIHTGLTGRHYLGLLATTVSDLNLRVAVTLHQLRLPAALAKTTLAVALQEFVDRVQPSDYDDWLTLIRTSQGVSRERLEDYVAAAMAGGPLVSVSSRSQQ
jgi:hypothetical protein